MLKNDSRNSNAGDVDLRHVTRQLFELVVIHVGMLHELVLQTAVLRKLFEQHGVSNEEFERLVAEAREQVGREPSEALERVQKLVETLQLKKQ